MAVREKRERDGVICCCCCAKNNNGEIIQNSRKKEKKRRRRRRRRRNDCITTPGCLAVLCYAREQSRVESSRVESSVGLLLLPLIYDRHHPLKPAAAAIQLRLIGEQRGNERPQAEAVSEICENGEGKGEGGGGEERRAHLFASFVAVAICC